MTEKAGKLFSLLVTWWFWLRTSTLAAAAAAVVSIRQLQVDKVLQREMQREAQADQLVARLTQAPNGGRWADLRLGEHRDVKQQVRS